MFLVYHNIVFRVIVIIVHLILCACIQRLRKFFKKIQPIRIFTICSIHICRNIWRNERLFYCFQWCFA
uniref:Putative secreted protein n=1 Tax=Panstrongylus lignarius TaxID=156445 RepID=A0A224XUY7_9HEMI